MAPPEANGVVEALKAFAVDRGADLFGVADLARVRAAVLGQGGPTAASFPRAVSLGMRLSDNVVDEHEPTETPAESRYWHHVYSVVTPALDFLANDVARWLDRSGWRTLAVPASLPYDPRKLQGIFSHKMGARLAGLGWIGKSCLLVTEEFGPRVRFVTVLTDAPLPPDAPGAGRCGKCTACVESCPVGAFTGTEFDESDDLAARFDAPRCRDYRKEHACGVCVASCPRGTPSRARAHAA